MPRGLRSPIPRPVTGLRAAGEWNTIEVALDANILRAFLNDAPGISDGVADSAFGAFGPFALYVGGTGEVRFKDVSRKDLQPRVAQLQRAALRRHRRPQRAREKGEGQGGQSGGQQAHATPP